MKLHHVREEILDWFQQHAGAHTAEDLADGLSFRGKSRKHLLKWVRALVADGQLVEPERNRFTLGREESLVEGDLWVSRAGDGYVRIGEADEDILVPREGVGRALPGDRVLVRIDTARREEGGTQGQVIRIVKRAVHRIVGTVKAEGYLLTVMPIVPGYRTAFRVPAVAGAALDDRVVVRFLGWPASEIMPEGEIVEVLGASTDPSLDTLCIMRQFDLPESFPPEVAAEAEAACARSQETAGRLDLSDRLVITVDPASARDYDDAISLEHLPGGRRRLGVHIADVSHYVVPGSALDREAARRGNSCYLPDHVVPMLPESLSNGACSLQPGRDRLTVSVFMVFTAAGEMVERSFARSVMRNQSRLTYEEVQDVLVDRVPATGGPPAPVCALLREVHGLAQCLRERRRERHALMLALPECEVVLTPDGDVTGIERVEGDASHQLIEECMVAANEAVATELANRGYPYIARYHAPPREQKIAALTTQLDALGFAPGDLTKASNLARFLESVAEHPLAEYVSGTVLRAMSRAFYAANRRGHFGLAKQHYAHFTSPIRRYPDLVTHRQLLAALGLAGTPVPAEALNGVARCCSQTEENADRAERALVELKKLRYVARQIELAVPRVYDAIVVQVVRFGVFVEVPALQVQGLVHVSRAAQGVMRFVHRRRELKGDGGTLGIGSCLRVFPVSVNMESGKIDFAVERPPAGRRSGGAKPRTAKPPVAAPARRKGRRR